MEEAVEIKEDCHQKEGSKSNVLQLTDPLLLLSPPWHELLEVAMSSNSIPCLLCCHKKRIFGCQHSRAWLTCRYSAGLMQG